MPAQDNYINRFIDEELVRANAERESTHESSGKLSASMLYQPLRFQVLKTIGVPRKPLDPYVLGKFKRGNDVEDWYVSMLDKAGVLVEAQKMVEYRDCVGYVDAIVDSDKMLFKKGLISHEVKSVTNAKLKRIAKTGVDYHYRLQATLYALALGHEYYAIDVLSSEDLRPNVYIFQTRELKRDVDMYISSYMQAMENWKASRVLPKFEANPEVAWTANKAYAMFSEEWIEATDNEVIKKLEELELV
jgi:hypothetical protein